MVRIYLDRCFAVIHNHYELSAVTLCVERGIVHECDISDVGTDPLIRYLFFDTNAIDFVWRLIEVFAQFGGVPLFRIGLVLQVLRVKLDAIVRLSVCKVRVVAQQGAHHSLSLCRQVPYLVLRRRVLVVKRLGLD